MSQRPRFLSPEELAQRRAADERQQEAKAAKAEDLKTEFGERFEHTAAVLGVDDAGVRRLAADRMATLLAERGSHPATMEHRDYMDIADRAVDFARDEDACRMAMDIDADKVAERADAAAPERQAESDPAISVERDPGREAEATPDRMPEADPTRAPTELSGDRVTEQREKVLEHQFAEYWAVRDGSDRSEGRLEQLAQRHEQELAAFDRQSGQPPAADRSASDGHSPKQAGLEAVRQEPDVDPEPHPPFSQVQFDLREEILRDAQGLDDVEPVRAGEREPAGAAENVRETPAGMAGPPAALEQTEPGLKRLRFYEDLKQEHANAIGRDDKADPKGQGKDGGKKLNFFEDRQPTEDHSREP